MPDNWISIITQTDDDAIYDDGVKIHDLIPCDTFQNGETFKEGEYPVLYNCLVNKAGGLPQIPFMPTSEGDKPYKIISDIYTPSFTIIPLVDGVHWEYAYTVADWCIYFYTPEGETGVWDFGDGSRSDDANIEAVWFPDDNSPTLKVYKQEDREEFWKLYIHDDAPSGGFSNETRTATFTTSDGLRKYTGDVQFTIWG